MCLYRRGSNVHVNCDRTNYAALVCKIYATRVDNVAYHVDLLVQGSLKVLSSFVAQKAPQAKSSTGCCCCRSTCGAT